MVGETDYSRSLGVLYYEYSEIEDATEGFNNWTMKRGDKVYLEALGFYLSFQNYHIPAHSNFRNIFSNYFMLIIVSLSKLGASRRVIKVVCN